MERHIFDVTSGVAELSPRDSFMSSQNKLLKNLRSEQGEGGVVEVFVVLIFFSC